MHLATYQSSSFCTTTVNLQLIKNHLCLHYTITQHKIKARNLLADGAQSKCPESPRNGTQSLGGDADQQLESHGGGMHTARNARTASGCILPAERSHSVGMLPDRVTLPCGGIPAGEAEPTTDKQRSDGFYHGISIMASTLAHGMKALLP